MKDRRASDTKPGRSRYRVPGYGWSARLAGLERRDQWFGFFLTTVIVFLVVIVGGYLLSALGVMCFPTPVAAGSVKPAGW